MVTKFKGPPLKMSSDDFNIMKSHIKSYVVRNPSIYEMYTSGKERKVLMQWFFLRASNIEGDSNQWICKHLYMYLNDTHIQTALDRCMIIIRDEIQEEEDQIEKKARELLLEEYGDETEDCDT